MESNLVSAFVKETNCDTKTAYTYLQSNCWDINGAIESWRFDSDKENHQQLGEDADSSERSDVKKLSRGISRATDNVNLVSRARCELAQVPCFKIDRFFIDTQEFTFTLPDLSVYGHDFRKFLEKDLIENSTLHSLEQSGRLNWWVESGICQRLWPLSTTGDGNCLLHAASLAMWGFHDRLLTLRSALHKYLECCEHRTPLYRRWRWQQTKLNDQSGFVYSESEWAKEWQNIVNMASTEPRRNAGVAGDRVGGGVVTAACETPAPPASATSIDTGTSASTYESLEEVHVLALAHVLRRPIVIVADVMLRDMNNEPFAPIPFGGVYLPLECSPKECHRSPLLLTYDMAHFSALVAMESANKEKDKLYAAIPLTDSDGVLLPLQFAVDPGFDHVWSEPLDQTRINSLILTEREQITLLKDYLDVIDISDGTTASPELDSEDEIDKRFAEVTDLSDSENTLFGNKNRAAKQLQSVARQFGSIGKSMSKKLKRNFSSISKVTKTKKGGNSRNGHIMCAEIHIKRHEYQEQMIKNYLLFAQKRFLLEQKQKLVSNNTTPHNIRLQEQALLEGPLKCINADCESFGTVLTSYMCNKCYETQRNEELSKINSDSRFGTGRSRFYRDTDLHSYSAIKNLPVSKSNTNPDRTLYLSKSTFYYDNDDSTLNLRNPLSENKTFGPPAYNDFDDGDDSGNNILRHDTNANIAPDEVLPGKRHISKFDFGAIDQNLNQNPEYDASKSKSTDKTVDSNTMVGDFGGDSLEFFLNKKKIRDQLIKDAENKVHNQNILSLKDNKIDDCLEAAGSSRSSSSMPLNQNENKNKAVTNGSLMKGPNYTANLETHYEIDIPRPATVPSNVSYNLSRKYPDYELAPRTDRMSEIQPGAEGCTTLQHCKTNHCTNLASAQSNYYCYKCSKDRKASDN